MVTTVPNFGVVLETIIVDGAGLGANVADVDIILGSHPAISPKSVSDSKITFTIPDIHADEYSFHIFVRSKDGFAYSAGQDKFSVQLEVTSLS